MSLTEFSGELKTEKEKLYEAALRVRAAYPETDASAGTYYTEYNAAKHFGGAETVFDSSELSGVREALNELWADDPDKAGCIPTILSAWRKSQDSAENYLPEVDLHNYMM